MATTNLLQWNPTAANQENDAAYLADSQRSGGATNPSLFDATLANKLFYQMSTFLAGLFTAFANKGFSTSDANLATLTAQCANFLTTADLPTGLQYLGYAPTLNFNAASYRGFQVTLNGGLAFTMSGLSVGQQILLAFTQDSVGGRAVTFPSNVVGYGAVDGTPNTTSQQLFEVLNDNLLHPAGVMTVS